jgi:hypothetical protein
MIKEKNTKFLLLERENDKLKTENRKLKEKLLKLETRINNNHSHHNSYNINSGLEDIIQYDISESDRIGNGRQIRIGRSKFLFYYKVMEILNNVNHIFHPSQDDVLMMDQVYPNPDNMTYEQLLELQEKIGYVNKGLNSEQINVMNLSNFRIYLKSPSTKIVLI